MKASVLTFAVLCLTATSAHAQTFISQPSGAQDGGYYIDEPHEGPYSEGVNQLDASRVRLPCFGASLAPKSPCGAIYTRPPRLITA